MWKVNIRRDRVGVVGLYGSGKTVFLTSVINHLQNHNPLAFRLGRDEREVVFNRELKPRRFPRFPYLECRNRIAENHLWPRKTRDTSEYRFEYLRTDWKLTRGELTLVDFPGERVADLAMAGKSYEEWSDWLVEVFTEHREYRNLAAPYLELTGRDVDPHQCVDAYRELTYQLYLNFRPFATPSTFVVAQNGAWLGEEERREHWREVCFAGLDVESQFAPLSKEARERHPELAQTLAGHYRRYRAEVALPLVKWLRHCDSLVVLVDVLMLLAGGEGMYNGAREHLMVLVDYLRPGTGLLYRLSRGLLDVLPGHRVPLIPDMGCEHRVQRIAFVATKADLVHENERGNLNALLEEMLSPLVKKHRVQRQLDVRYFSCASVKSAESMPDGRLQAFRPGEPDAPELFDPLRVPDHWPLTWQHGKYQYFKVAPWMPPRRDAAPRQFGLDEVMRFALRWDR